MNESLTVPVKPYAGTPSDAKSITVLESIPWSFDPREYLTAIGALKTGDDQLIQEALRLASAVVPLLVPKAVYRMTPVERADTESGLVVLDGHLFKSKVLARNLKDVGRVFPFIITCGNGAEAYNLEGHDFLASYWLDEIKENALNQAVEWFEKRLRKETGFKHLSAMNPGSGKAETWPLSQQEDLFKLLADGSLRIGVTLTDSYLMIPNKTVSGVLFPSQVDFINCQLCDRENCGNRRAPYLSLDRPE